VLILGEAVTTTLRLIGITSHTHVRKQERVFEHKEQQHEQRQTKRIYREGREGMIVHHFLFGVAC
jgi:hypothetical protein